MKVTFSALRTRLEADSDEASSASSSDTERDVASSTSREPLSRVRTEPGPRSPPLVARRESHERRGSHGSNSPFASPHLNGQDADTDVTSIAGPSRRNSLPDIPTYDEALAADPDASLSPSGIRALRLTAYNAGQAGPSLAGISTSTLEDDDDPLVPRVIRAPPERVLRPLRRATEPVLQGHTLNSVIQEQDDEVLQDDDEASREAVDTSGDAAAGLQSQLDPSQSANVPLELPAPPADALPSYTPHLAADELRLISTVHLDQNHPAASFFSAMAASAITANPLAEPPPAADEQSTGGKKLKLTITSGGELMNGTGRVYVRLGRGGVVEGKVYVGKVDHATGLEVSVSEFCV